MRVAPPDLRPRAVVFDLDGVLVDSEGLWGRAEARVVESLGGRWEPAIQEAMLGRGPSEAATVLAAFLGHTDIVEVERRLLDAALAAFDGGVRARDGAGALVASLRERVPLAVATNSRRALAEASLRSAGLDGMFAAVVTADEAAAPKPDPAPYRQACVALGVPPGRVVAIEDSPVGTTSAREAGCWVLGCPSRPGAPLGLAHAVVDDLGAIDAETLLAGGLRPR